MNNLIAKINDVYKEQVCLFLGCCLSPWLCCGQVIKPALTSYYAGMGAYTLHHTDAFSFTNNQASLAQLKETSAGIYSERRFLLQELSSYTAVIAMPTTRGNFGMKASFGGQANYSELQAGLAFGKKLGDRFDIGVQFNYTTVNAGTYGSAKAWSFELGVLLHLSDKLHAGLQVNNPVGGKFTQTQPAEKMPAVFTMGWCYEAGENLYCICQIIKEEDQPVNVHAGLHYAITPQVFMRVGIMSSTSSLQAGIGLLWKKIRLDITSAYHPQLGLTPGLLLLVAIKPPKA